MKHLFLDTETTGLGPKEHRIIEIGVVEMVERRLTGRRFHYYLNPERDVEPGAVAVHGLTRQFLSDKPLFKDILPEFLEFITDATLIIHNAPFDVGFLEHELMRAKHKNCSLSSHVKDIIDTLAMARQKYPGQKNSLDALCKRLKINNSHRELHGALLDSEILAEVYLAMTGGQTAMNWEAQASQSSPAALASQVNTTVLGVLHEVPVVRATSQEALEDAEYFTNQ